MQQVWSIVGRPYVRQCRDTGSLLGTFCRLLRTALPARYGQTVSFPIQWCNGLRIPTAPMMGIFAVDLREQARTTLQQFLPPQLAGHSLELRLAIGHPFEEILALATRAHVDLIVMGTHGRTGLERGAPGLMPRPDGESRPDGSGIDRPMGRLGTEIRGPASAYFLYGKDALARRSHATSPPTPFSAEKNLSTRPVTPGWHPI